MTLDEAIIHAEEVIIENLEKANGRKLGDPITIQCILCAEEHMQLAVWLKELKQLREQTKWIPVSERLPEENEHIGGVCRYYLVQDEYGDMLVARYTKIGWVPIRSLKSLGDEIVAWMSLPEPYKAESEVQDADSD